MAVSISSIGFTQPDFVICGAPLASGWVRLLASKELSKAELEAQFGFQDVYDDDYESLIPDAVMATSVKVSLTVEFMTWKQKAFVLIDAPDYPSAFRALFEDWTPARDVHPAIGRGQQEISA